MKALKPRTRKRVPKKDKINDVKGRKHRYPTTEDGKKRLFKKAQRYIKRLFAGKVKKRDYKLEYFYYHARPIEKKRRRIRTTHRNKYIKLGKVKKYDGTEIDHLKPDTLSYNHIVVRKSRCSHNRAWGNHCKHCNRNVL